MPPTFFLPPSLSRSLPPSAPLAWPPSANLSSSFLHKLIDHPSLSLSPLFRFSLRFSYLSRLAFVRAVFFSPVSLRFLLPPPVNPPPTITATSFIRASVHYANVDSLYTSLSLFLFRSLVERFSSFSRSFRFIPSFPFREKRSGRAWFSASGNLSAAISAEPASGVEGTSSRFSRSDF